MEQVNKSYNEADAAAFVKKETADSLKGAYELDDIACILDLIYEYYESIEDEMTENPDMLVNVEAMGTFINEQLKESNMRELAAVELESILMADNAYMDSIGMNEDEDVVNLDEVIDELYVKLPAEIRKKYNEDEVYSILCFEADYHDANEFIDIDDMRTYILNRATKEGLDIDIETLMVILKMESELLGEEDFYEE